VEKRKWVRTLAIIATPAVILQGILGGLRVTLIKNEIGIFHGMLAQSFFVLLGILFVATGASFIRGQWMAFSFDRRLLKWALVATVLIFLQLTLGVTMRHAHAGLSIPDFPLAYGKWWPPMNAGAIAKINQERLAESEMPTNAFQMNLQMIHRLNALLIAVAVCGFVMLTWKRGAAPASIRGWGIAWLLLIFCQIALGAYTIWSRKAPEIATAHVILGALLLLLGSILTFRLFCAARPSPLLHENAGAGMMKIPA
jgi:cytochrome c oxidase assembly protein subunit 15